jgi:EAL domain-containing protein (putative c-di-GMP-specific phosphodiesterase class I)
VKIDKQFIDELGGGRKKSSLAHMMLQMTASLEVISVAEGIEQLADFRRMGCDVGQGYLLSWPLESHVIRQRFGLDVAADQLDMAR